MIMMIVITPVVVMLTSRSSRFASSSARVHGAMTDSSAGEPSGSVSISMTIRNGMCVKLFITSNFDIVTIIVRLIMIMILMIVIIPVVVMLISRSSRSASRGARVHGALTESSAGEASHSSKHIDDNK